FRHLENRAARRAQPPRAAARAGIAPAPAGARRYGPGGFRRERYAVMQEEPGTAQGADEVEVLQDMEAWDADDSGAGAPALLPAVRELVLRAHPEVVPELVQGESVADLLASIAPAAEAYQRLMAGAARRTH